MSNAQGPEGDSPNTIAAFDIGSNTIKMTVGRMRDSDGLEEFLWRAETVRLGQGIDKSGRLDDERMNAASDTIVRFSQEARENGATRLIGVATEATRIAENGEEFLNRIRQESGLELTSITGDREADLTFRGIAASSDISGNILVADIGGASTELIAAENERVSFSQSLAIGSGRLTDRNVVNDPPTKAEIQKCRFEARDTFRQVADAIGKRDRLIVVGGTGEYMKLLVADENEITVAEVDDVLDFLSTIGSAELSDRLTIPVARAKVLSAGIAIVRALADLTEPSVIEGARSGIRTGLLLAAFAGEI